MTLSVELYELMNLSMSLILQAEGDVEETPAELLYRAMLPSLPQYMVSQSVTDHSGKATDTED